MLGTLSRTILSLPLLRELIGSHVIFATNENISSLDALLVWGRKPSANQARKWALKRSMALIQLEDGFLRSYAPGQRNPPLSLVVDEVGIYYDSTMPSRLESLLASGENVLAGLVVEVERARTLLLTHGLSKYNHASNNAGKGCFGSSAIKGGREEHGHGRGDRNGLPRFPRKDGAKTRSGMAGRCGERSDATIPLSTMSTAQLLTQRVLVIDQTAGDISVALGGASAQTFADMLAAARAENPQATIYVKTHPEVSSGRKGGYLTNVQDELSPGGQRTVVLRGLLNPLQLIEQMDRVYVVSSTMGFEALLAGKPVVCFGVPWYAGWGVTDDRCTQTTAWARRRRKRTVEELFAAAYFHYTRYLNPLTHERGSIFDVIHWLINQKRMAQATQGAQGRTLAVGFRRWKAANLKPMLGLDASRVHFVATAQAAERLAPGPADRLLFWGRTPPPGVAELAQRTQAKLVRLEDGFVRSVGLGSDLIRPHSLVLDSSGLYFDPSQPSDLERLLGTQVFSADDLLRAEAARDFIVHHGLTKYNLEPRQPVQWASGGKRVLLVPGQVEDDASIRFGCTTVKTNLALLQAAREAQPGAFIVYKPHPDVASGNRRGRVALQAARQWADHVEVDVSIVSCIEACDEVHTMTSLTGFDALLRGKHVVTYGQPFYAGWGLTRDRAGEGGASTPAFERRTRQLSLDELVAGTLLHYPLYWDWKLSGYTTCEAVLNTLLAERTALEASKGLASLHTGWLRRQGRKLSVLWQAWTHPV